MERKVTEEDKIWSVIVIGAGVSGLQCARSLVHGDVDDVLVVEASSRAGGRILQSTTLLPDRVIELGAEFIHGDETILMEMAKENEWPLREVFTWAQGDGGPSEVAPDGGVGYYYLGDSNELLQHDASVAEFQHLNEILWKMEKNTDIWEDGDTRSLLDYLNEEKVSPAMIALAEAGYSNTAGSVASKLSYRASCRQEKQWSDQDGERDFRIEHGFGQVVELLEKEVPLITYNWPVQKIDYSHEDRIVRISNELGSVLLAKRVVITVPVTMYKTLQFIPQLPIWKTDAMNTVGMGGAVKLLLIFKKIFWPTNCHGVVCSHSLLPEFWINSTSGVGHRIPEQETTADLSDELFLITGFAMDVFADRITEMGSSVAISAFLNQLNVIFKSKDNTTPASDAFLRGSMHDWSSVEYIRGGYSFPMPHQKKDDVTKIAKNVSNQIFFAGEATAAGFPGLTVHSAIKTGTRAANQILFLDKKI